MTDQHWRCVSVPGPIPYQNKSDFRETLQNPKSEPSRNHEKPTSSRTLTMTSSLPEPVQSPLRSCGAQINKTHTSMEHVPVLEHTTSLWARCKDKNGSIDWNKLYMQSHLRWFGVIKSMRCITLYLSIIVCLALHSAQRVDIQKLPPSHRW